MATCSLSQADARIIIQKLHEAEVFNIVVTGGEPLVNMPTALTCIEEAISRGIEVNMNSGLTLLTADRASVLRKAGLGHILTSILGPTSNIHDTITQRSGSFESLFEGIKAAKDAGIQVSGNMVVSQINFGRVRETATLAAKLGMKSFSATKAGCPGNCSDFSGLALSIDQVVHLLNDLCWAHDELGIEVGTLEPVPLCGIYGVVKPELFLSRKCTAGVTSMTVSYDGSVRPCSHLDLAYGNLLHEGFSDVWSRMNMWSEGTQVPDECRKCSLLPICGAGCRMESKTRNHGKLDSLDPYARPENIPLMSAYFQNIQAGGAAQTEPIAGFRTAKFRTRSESFGGVVALYNSKRILLDRRGFAVVLQLRPNCYYDMSDATIDWKGLDPLQFVSGLKSRGVVR